MKGLVTTVNNIRNGKKYIVSTVSNNPHSEGFQTMVFQKRFWPFANYRQPQVGFFGNDAVYLHNRVIAIVRDVDPSDWYGEDMFISAESDEATAGFDAMMARLRRGE